MQRHSRRWIVCFFLFLTTLVLNAVPVQADWKLLDRLKVGRHRQRQKEPYKPKFGVHNEPPPKTMIQLANVLDIIEEGIRDDGTVVMQTPSVWGQNRMTRYRKDFEDQMKAELERFRFILSARIARTDQAALENQTSLAATLTPTQRGTQIALSQSELLKERASLETAVSSILSSSQVKLDQAKTFDLLSRVFNNLGTQENQLGLEPTVYLDEKKRYLDHLNQHRRINLGDDNADSAGYGMYLVRMPVSIEPGQKTHRGHGAILTATAQHEFEKFFLQRTMRNLIINDLVEHLTPLIFEILDSEAAKTLEEQFNTHQELNSTLVAIVNQYRVEYCDLVECYFESLEKQIAKTEASLRTAQLNVGQLQQSSAGSSALNTARCKVEKLERALRWLVELRVRSHELRTKPSLAAGEAIVRLLSTVPPGVAEQNRFIEFMVQTLESLTDSGKANQFSPGPPSRLATNQKQLTDNIKDKLGFAPNAKMVTNALRFGQKAIELQKVLSKALKFEGIKVPHVPAQVVNGKTYPIAPSDLLTIFGEVPEESAIRALLTIRNNLKTKRTRAIDIRNLLTRELNAAYDLMEDGIPNHPAPLTQITLFNNILKHFKGRRFTDETDSLHTDYLHLMGILQNQVQGHPLGAFCWAIAVDAALLNEHLREDIARYEGINGFSCTANPEELYFYLPRSMAEDPLGIHASEVFQEYVRTRWPLLVFALDPVVDQQNIADAYSLRRELQLALAYAFASGRLSFNRMARFQRRIELDAETIALNRTVTTFGHQNDTFGWRFTPRYQNPPDQSNLRTYSTLLWRTAPGSKYQLNQSKLERGQRELTAVILMPSFLNQIRMDTRGNWFRLSDPDDLTIPTARMLEQGRYVMQAMQTDGICDASLYRGEDLRRLYLKAQQMEKMLPLQTYNVQIPYENTLGGFELFGQGTTALVPVLVGYEGVGTHELSKYTDVLLYGKNISIHETKVVAGGRHLTETDVDILSRQVIRIRISKDARPTTIKDGREFIEIHLATPNGISNRILIPLRTAPPLPKPVSTYSISAGEVKVKYQIAETKNGGYLARLAAPLGDQKIAIDWAPVGSFLNPIAVEADFTLNTANLKVGLDNVQSNGVRYAIEGDQLMIFVNHLLMKLSSTHLITPTTPLPDSLTATTVSIKPTLAEKKPVAQAAGELKIIFELFIPDGGQMNPAPQGAQRRRLHIPSAKLLPVGGILPESKVSSPKKHVVAPVPISRWEAQRQGLSRLYGSKPEVNRTVVPAVIQTLKPIPESPPQDR